MTLVVACRLGLTGRGNLSLRRLLACSAGRSSCANHAGVMLGFMAGPRAAVERSQRLTDARRPAGGWRRL